MIRRKWRFIGRAHDGATYLFVAGEGFGRDFHEVPVDVFWREA